MKRLFILILFAAGISACELYSGDIYPQTGQNLKYYTMDAFSGYVMMPVMMAELAVDFDAYLALPDEEKANDFRFFGNIRNPEENLYIIEEGNTLCTLKTDGRSLWDDNARWTFLSYRTRTELNGSGDLYCAASESIVIESYPSPAEDEADRLFSMTLGDDPVGLELSVSDDGKFEWNVGSQGVIDDEDGYFAEYMTGAAGISVTKRYNEASKEYEYICSGEFLLSFFRDDEPVDMCKAIFRPGLLAEFIGGK